MRPGGKVIARAVDVVDDALVGAEVRGLKQDPAGQVVEDGEAKGVQGPQAEDGLAGVRLVLL